MNLIRFNKARNPKTFSSVLDEFFNTGFPEVFNNEMNWNTPSTNIIEHDNGYTIEMAVPGANKDNIDIKLENDQLIVESKHSAENVEESEEKNYRLRQFNYSAFRKSFYLSESIDAGKIHAQYKDGILNIELEKKEEAKPQAPRTIEIK